MPDYCDPNSPDFDFFKCTLQNAATGGESKSLEINDPRGIPYPNIKVEPNSYYKDPQTGLVQFWNGKASTLAPEWVQKEYGGISGSGGSSQRLASDDPRYWQFQYDQLDEQAKEHVDQIAYDYYNAGMTAENARRQALSQFIQSRDSLSANTAQTSASVAKQIADYAANPRDTYAEAVYRNQVGGSTPFGDLQNQAFGDYGKALQQKGVNIFQNVAGDLEASRRYRDALPLNDWLPADLRGAGQPGATAPASAPAGAGAVNPLSSFVGLGQNDLNAVNQIADQRNPLRSFVGLTPTDLDAVRQIDLQRQQAASPTPQGATTPPKVYGTGGTIDFGNLTRFGSDQPSSSEGGTNMNIHEPAVLIGLHSGRHYATVAENGYPEQIKITPTPSGKKAAMEAEKAGKAQKDVMGKAFGTGGTINSDPSIDDMNSEYSKLLERLGGSGGGSSTPFGGARFLAGAPANALLNDPFLKGITEARYSALPSLGGAGLSPEDLWAQVQKFTPTGITNNSPRVNFA